MRAQLEDAPYAAALAKVDACIATLESACRRGQQLVAEGALARCPECGERFRPKDGHQFLCSDPGCLRARKTRLQRLYRARSARRAPLTFRPRVSPDIPAPLAHGGRCDCGGDLEFITTLDGLVLERCRAMGCGQGYWKRMPRRKVA